MTPSTYVPLRLPKELVARIDAVARLADPKGSRLRSRIVREALEAGLPAVEREYRALRPTRRK